MTKKEIKAQKALGTYLQTVWTKRCTLTTRGNKFKVNGERLFRIGETLTRNGDTLFAEAVKEIYGKDVWIKYLSDKCVLSNGVEFNDTSK